MTALKIAILGLDRIGTSVGLAVRRYMDKGGKHEFELVGYDLDPLNMKEAKKLGAIDKSEGKVYNAVDGCDLVVIALSYDEVKDTYKRMAPDLKDGVVVLDASPLKRPSLDWSDEYLGDEHHMIGITPIVNPRHLFKVENTIEQAAEDMFDKSAIILSPSAKAIKEAVDLAFSFCQILGSKPRFLDPLEHDTLLAQTEALPNLLGVALFYNLMNQQNWDDLKWFTNPAFGALTRPLHDKHPDALRDIWLQNDDVLVRSIDQMIATLQEFRQALAAGDKDAIEATIVAASDSYEQWINSRHRADWDKVALGPKPSSGSVMGSLLGNSLSDKLFGDKDDD